VGAGRWHGFVNSGTGRLRILCIHASDRIIQEFLDPRETPPWQDQN